MTRPRRVIYGKLGRAVILEPRRWGPVGGDHEALYFLEELARRHPDVEFVIGSRYVPPDEGANALPPNVTLPPLPGKVHTRYKYVGKRGTPERRKVYDESVHPWEESTEILEPYFTDDARVLMWLGQHGGTNCPIPSIEKGRDVLTKPQDAHSLYAAPITLNINRWREEDPLEREEVWLLSDVRNFLKARELKWPDRHPVLAQFDFRKNIKHERYGDPRSPRECGFEAAPEDGVWKAVTQYVHAGLEVVRPRYQVEHGWEERVAFRVLANEALAGKKLPRARIFKEWCSGLTSEVLGKWTPEGAAAAGILSATPVHQSAFPEMMGLAKSTFTMPTSGSGWPTPKPHEMFRLGTICFFHPAYDVQGHVVPTHEQLRAGAWADDPSAVALAGWLRPSTPEELRTRVEAVASSRETYEWLRDEQLRLEQRYIDEDLAFRSIEARLGLDSAC